MGGRGHLTNKWHQLTFLELRKKTFLTIENQIGTSWEKILAEEISKAGEEEKKLAMERNDYVDGCPAITVIIDGGWSKRSHKHSYNAKSGVGIIIGKETKKILYIGIRNKFCSICTVASNKGVQPKKHTCFRNWCGSSSAMESDIIVCGFNAAEEMHGVRYMRVIGDGDSSVLSDIQQFVPVWGNTVTKIECANHAIKCYRNRLEKIIQDFPKYKYKGRGKLTKRAITRLAFGARCAIKMHMASKNIAQLRQDLRNGPNHVFNEHSNCSPSFCKVAANVTEAVPVSNVTPPCTPEDVSDAAVLDDILGEELESENDMHVEEDEAQGGDNSVTVNNVTPPSTPEDVSDVEAVLDDILGEELESENDMHVEEDEARGGDNSVSIKTIPYDLFFRIQRAGDRIVSIASQLVSNQTTNLAECFMNIRCKFDGGKFYNRVQRGSFQHRCYGAGLRFQMGPDWSSLAWSRATGTEPGTITAEHSARERHNHTLSNVIKTASKYKEQRKKAK